MKEIDELAKDTEAHGATSRKANRVSQSFEFKVYFGDSADLIRPLNQFGGQGACPKLKLI